MPGEIPRRLPPTPEERLNVVVSRMAGGSSAGATRWASPVGAATYHPAEAFADEPVSGAGFLMAVLDTDAFIEASVSISLTGGTEYLIEHYVTADASPGSSMSVGMTYPFGSSVSPRTSPVYGEAGGLARDYPDGERIIDHEWFLVTAGTDGEIAMWYGLGSGAELVIYRGSFLRATPIGSSPT